MIEVAIAALVALAIGYALGCSSAQRKIDRLKVKLLQLAGASSKMQVVRETAFYVAKGLDANQWDHEAFVKRIATARGLDGEAEKKN
jgi:hypothetical protein